MPHAAAMQQSQLHISAHASKHKKRNIKELTVSLATWMYPLPFFLQEGLC
jgi:hypothetical protein